MRETWSVLQAAVSAGYIAPPGAAVVEKMKHVIGTLTKCIKVMKSPQRVSIWRAFRRRALNLIERMTRY